eukprot:scaffold39923_cov64-Phaeocystis_antarctica.AAC.8
MPQNPQLWPRLVCRDRTRPEPPVRAPGGRASCGAPKRTLPTRGSTAGGLAAVGAPVAVSGTLRTGSSPWWYTLLSKPALMPRGLAAAGAAAASGAGAAAAGASAAAAEGAAVSSGAGAAASGAASTSSEAMAPCKNASRLNSFCRRAFPEFTAAESCGGQYAARVGHEEIDR